MPIVRTRTPAGEKIVLMSEEDFARLTEAVADARDEAALAVSIAKDGRQAAERFTFEDVDALRAAPSPLHFWRRRRAMTQSALASRSARAREDLFPAEG